MKVLNVQSKDIWVTFELPLIELKYIKEVFDHTEIVFNSKGEPKMEVANAYIQDHFYPLISKLIEDLEQEK